MKPTLAPLTALTLACFLSRAPAAETPASQPSTQPAPLLTPAESKNLDTIIAATLAAGFPDAKNATVYAGQISIRATFDPAKPPLPSSASTMQESIPNSKNMTYGYTFDGLHFKLPDGTWIIATAFHFKPAPGDSVNTDDATKINLATLVDDAFKALPIDAEKDASKYLDAIDPAQRERSKNTLNRLAPVLQYLHLTPDATTPALILLHQSGFQFSNELALVIADVRSRSFWQLHPWSVPDPAFDPTGQYPASAAEEEAWTKLHPPFTAEAPDTALRRALFRWCRAQMSLSAEDALLPLGAAAAITKASIDPDDPQHFAPRVDFQAAGMRLPIEPPEKADLPTQLQSWEARPRPPKMVVASGNAAPGSIAMSTSFTAPAAAYTPKKEDLDSLVALLADNRPSRFVDFSGPRTLGDNAWRALATLLKSDPRTLANYPTDKPWTPEERKSAAAAVQSWWKDHRTDYLNK